MNVIVKATNRPVRISNTLGGVRGSKSECRNRVLVESRSMASPTSLDGESSVVSWALCHSFLSYPLRERLLSRAANRCPVLNTLERERASRNAWLRGL
jgi:hypothetical protein